MSINDFLEKLKATPDDIEFSETMAVIDQNYAFNETAFTNGSLENKAGENSGSCKLFSFARMHDLDEKQTLSCFGTYYRDDVLSSPDANDHQNIRNFMQSGWGGVLLSDDVLIRK